jgi:membrane-associated phospholipid phosphatase
MELTMNEPASNPPHLQATTNRYLFGLIVGAVLFIITLLISRTHQFSGLQLQIFRVLNNLPDGLRLPALWISEGLGAAYPIILCALIPVLYKRYRLAWRFAVAGVGSVVGLELGKLIAKEPRPVVLLHGQLHLRANEPGLTSFPSGHMAAATALALVLWAILPKQWRWLSVVWILLMAVSRLYLGVHTPNDLAGGFALGLIVVCIIWLLPRSLSKPLHLDNDKPLLDRGW